ncbi:LTA synthase family protein [Cohnella yongneupensis]|uniref:LTA synthase family protein n=1 Tax=Cohnella yongneupensis TaxID=425006 RepID=A0ABW0QU45_9BACL
MIHVSLWLKLINRRFLLFTVILALKGSLAWYVVFADGPSWQTVVTEVPFFWVIFCLIEWFAKRRKVMYYVIVNLLVTVLYFAVLMYYKYYGIIATYHALKQADKVTAVGNSTYSLMDPYYLLVFFDIFVLAGFLIRASFKARSVRKPIRVKPFRKPAISIMITISFSLCFFNIWTNKASMNENKQAEEMGILNYEIYTIFADTTEDEDLVEMEDITQSTIDQLKGITKPVAPQFEGVAKGKNLLIIQMESYQNFLIGLKIGGKELTPNMNKLAKDDFHFNHFYTSVGQGTTSDAEFTVNTSLYVPKHEPATDNYVGKALPSLPKLLKAQGYETATFHTNQVDFWNRRELYSAVGWDRYYDRDFFGDDDHIAFGASDEVLYNKTFGELQKINAGGQPFYAQMITMSSHHPFDIPSKKVMFDLPDEYEGTLVGHYLEAQNYADYALGQFIDQLKSSGLWDNTVVMLYGDHQGLPLYSLDKHEKTLMELMLGHEYGYTDMFNIPLVVHIPGVSYPKELDNTGGEIDILPTVANLMGISLDNQIHFGEDIFNQNYNMLPMRHFLPSGSVFTDHKLFLPGKAYADGENYPLPNVPDTASNVTEQQYNNTLELLHLSDSYVPQLPDKDPNVVPEAPKQ